jgi:histidinol-phosphate/aromatic aminotransferase/cobyric acid decarboxylase-like protein
MRQAAAHGGEFFHSIGEDFRSLERSREIVNADVLDAWFDPAPEVLARLHEYLPFLARTSPPLHAEGLVQAIAETRGIPEECVLTGSGSSSLLFSCLPRLIEPGSTALLLDPTYGEYAHLAETVLEAQIARLKLAPEREFLVDAGEMRELTRALTPEAVFLVNPNSPTGRLWPRAELLAWLDDLPESTLVLVDETYIDYAGAESLESEAVRRKNLVVVKSMSKAYALSGLRVGYLVAHADLADELYKYLPPWPVGLLAQVAAVEALRRTDYYRARWAETHALRREVCERLAAIEGLKPHDSEANFYLLELDEPARAAARLRERGIFVREGAAMGGGLADRFLRIAVKDRDQNERIAAALEAAR